MGKSRVLITDRLHRLRELLRRGEGSTAARRRNIRATGSARSGFEERLVGKTSAIAWTFPESYPAAAGMGAFRCVITDVSEPLWRHFAGVAASTAPLQAITVRTGKI